MHIVTNNTLMKRYPMAIFLVLMDLIIMLSAAHIAYWLRFDRALDGQSVYFFLVVFSSLLFVLIGGFGGLYESMRGQRKRQLVTRMTTLWLIAFGVLVTGLYVFDRNISFSRLWLFLWLLLSLGLGASFRIGLYGILARVGRWRNRSKRLLLFGNAQHMQPIADYFNQYPLFGYQVAHQCAMGDQGYTEATKQQLLALIAEHKPHEVWICIDLTQSAVIKSLLYDLRHCVAQIRYLPNLADRTLLNHRPNQVAGLHTIDLSCTPLNGYLNAIKRMEDVIIGSLITLLILPVCALIALAIKFSSPGPVLFRQTRYGLNGRPIEIYKFRSMVVDQPNDHVKQATKNDQRITPVGRFIRRTSLDELPQFFNVLQGRMSIVGPRPHALAHNEYYKDLVEAYMQRHKMKPGITGWAQVNGFRGETDTLEKMQARVDYDFWYIEHWSLWLDLRIIFWTVFKGFTGKNAY